MDGFRVRFSWVCAALLTSAAALAYPPVSQDPTPANLAVTPQELELEAGDKVQLQATVTDEDGKPLDTTVLFFSMSRRHVSVSPAGLVEAIRPGEFVLLARVPRDPEQVGRRDASLLETSIKVRVPLPPIESIEIVGAPGRFYEGTTVRLETRIVDSAGTVRDDLPPAFTSSNPELASVDAHGYVTTHRTGQAQIAAKVETAETALSVTIVDNPTASLTLRASANSGRTGDVIHFETTARDGSGNTIADVPITYGVHTRTVEHDLGEPSSALIAQDGRFVADLPGEYTVVAVSGVHSASRTVAIEPRNVRGEIELVGHGRVSDRYTADLWVWEGTDGRDYAITGTWSAEGHAYVWDVTDPANMVIVDTVRVDARTVNDVKVSEDGRTAVISREGASNRRNGIVILDVSDPTQVQVLASYDDQLTGGVHNLFVYQDHVYALSAGQRYDVINIEDPRNPYRVGRFELDTPGHGVHDVWVEDGIAYSSNWTDGVVAVDIGGGGKGGSPRNPVMIGSYAYPSGWNHAAFPYRSKSTGKFYVFAGDEAAASGVYVRDPQPGVGTPRYEGEPYRWRGWIHVIEWDEWGEPREVARYQVPEGGSHNLWVEDDILYIGFYDRGLRIVDVSGELMGDLYRQGREIGYFLPYDPQGFVRNSPQVWGPQPYKGNIFFADHSSGLWAVRLKSPDETARE